MKCHYEVLGISFDASVEDIKKAYRKLALEWHPDKNLHRTEEATETFQLIQQAYDILIDPQERAWYDRNRDKILKGDEDYVDDHLDVYQYFNTSRFKGYGDDEKSFYAVYRGVFEKIADEDKPFMDDGDITVPSFGYSYSSYKEEVHPFYAHWQSYCTAKTYTWVDRYDLAEARKCGVGRQVIRCMERENKKLREQHRRIRNEEIRQLVAFVRKRDKRIEDHKKHVEKENAEKARKAQEHRRKQIAERKKYLANYKESEWVSMSALESHLNEIEANLDFEFGAESSSDKGEEDPVSDVDGSGDLYCIACDKAFRSAKAMTNHQNSKKHKENVASLKEFMQDGDMDLADIGNDLPNGDEHDDLLKSSEEQDVYETKQSSSKRKKKKKKKLKDQFTDDTDLNLCGLLKDISDLQTHVEFEKDDDSEVSLLRPLKTDLFKEYEVFPEHEDVGNTSNPPQKFSKTDPMKCGRIPKQVQKHSANDIAEIGENSQLKTETYKDDTEASLSSHHKSQGCKRETVIEEDVTKKSKSAQRKAKKKTTLNTDEQAQQVTTTCVKCGKIFGSRNRLFDHLKETGHSTFLSDKDRETLKLKKKKET